MLKFKKRYENQTIVLSDGTLISAATIASPRNQKLLKASTSYSYMLDDATAKAEEPTTAADPPVTGGGGAGDPRPAKKATTKKKS